jgi:hypothetical protein
MDSELASAFVGAATPAKADGISLQNPRLAYVSRLRAGGTRSETDTPAYTPELTNMTPRTAVDDEWTRVLSVLLVGSGGVICAVPAVPQSARLK